MKLLLVVNPIAGRGRARTRAASLAERLRADGHDVRTIESGPEADHVAPPDRPDAIVVLGGDGTVHALADVARRLDAPLYQYPLGTENLFAREFAMDRRYATLARALQRHHVERVDLARCNDRTFLLMVSAGPDANIIHRLAGARRGSISHLSYVPHIVAEVARPALTPLRVVADGRVLVDGRPGIAVVANSRQYAMRLDPAKDARMRDGMLDVVFLPVSGRLALLKWIVLVRLRLQERTAGAVMARAREVTIESPGAPPAYQIDGEAGPPPTPDPEHPNALRVTVEHAALPVLVP